MYITNGLHCWRTVDHIRFIREPSCYQFTRSTSFSLQLLAKYNSDFIIIFVRFTILKAVGQVQQELRHRFVGPSLQAKLLKTCLPGTTGRQNNIKGLNYYCWPDTTAGKLHQKAIGQVQQQCQMKLSLCCNVHKESKWKSDHRLIQTKIVTEHTNTLMNVTQYKI